MPVIDLQNHKDFFLMSFHPIRMQIYMFRHITQKQNLDLKNVGNFEFKKIDIVDNNIILIVEIHDYEKYLFVFQNNNNLYIYFYIQIYI